MNKKLHAKNNFSSNFYTKCKTDYPLRLSDTIFQSYKRKLNRFYHPHNIFSISNIILVYLEKKVQPEFSFKHLKKIHLNIYNYLHYSIIFFFFLFPIVTCVEYIINSVSTLFFLHWM